MVEDSKFSNTILTNIGHQMLTSISNGNRKITYTKAEAYVQDVSSISNETLKALTSLQGKELSANLLVSNDGGDVVTITANFRNKGLTKDVVFNSIGWFAKLDTDDAERGITANQEYLIGITPANGTQTLVAPPADQSSSQAISINLNMTLSDASNVNMTVNDAGAVHFNQLDDQLAKYTTTADLTKLLAGKADLGLSYTKAEIDAKLLHLTTDTDGKVSADQVQALISDKANISDVYTKRQVDSALSTRDTKISTKANASDVYTKSQVDSALSTRDSQINTKANISDVYTKSDVDNALAVDRGRLGKLEGTQTLDSPDFNSITSTGVYYITNNNPANIKNNPVSQWGVLVVSNGNGNRTSQVYYPDDGSPQWCRLLNGNNWLPWYQLSTKKDISNAINKFDLSKVKFRKQYMNGDGQPADKTWSATKNEDGTYTIDLYNDDRTASKLHDVLVQLPNKADISTVNAQIADVKDTAQSNLNKVKSDLNGAINTKANSSDLTALDKKAVKSVGIYPNNLHFDNGSFNYWSGEVKASPDTNGYALIDLTDDTSVQAAANQLNAMLTGLNHLQGTVNGKADKTDVASLQNTVNNIDSTRTPIVAGNSGDDLFSFKTSQIRLYNGNGSTCKNLPPARNTNWFAVQYIFEYHNSAGIAIYTSPASEIWTAGCNGGRYTPWVRVANSNDISNLQNQVDSKTSGMIVTDYNIADKNPTKETNRYINRWLVDQGALTPFADQINQLKGRRSVDAPDFNTLTDTGVYFITNQRNGKNFPPTWSWGSLAVFNGNGQRNTQIYFADNGNEVFVRSYWITNGAMNWSTWNQLAWKSDITSLQNNVYTKSDIDGKVNISSNLFRRIQNSNTWGDIFGVYNPSNVLTSLRIDPGPGGSGSLLNNFAAGIGFGGFDTKGVLSVDYLSHQARITGGNGDKPVWSEDIAWKSDINSLQSTINQQNQTIQSLTTRLNNAENEIKYIKDNYIEGKRFPASQEAQANSWENEKPTRLAMIEK